MNFNLALICPDGSLQMPGRFCLLFLPVPPQPIWEEPWGQVVSFCWSRDPSRGLAPAAQLESPEVPWARARALEIHGYALGCG